MNKVSISDLEITRCLRSAAEHLQSAVEMTNAAEPCEQVLHQLNAVRTALHHAGIKIVECQIQSCQDAILNSESVEERIHELHYLPSLYAIYIQQYRSKDESNYEPVTE